MKKILNTILAVLEVLLVAGAYIVKYFTAKKMGMARHVIFLNQTWEKAYPLETWKLLSVALLAVLLAAVIFLLVKRRGQLRPWQMAEAAAALALTGFSLYFTLHNSVAVLRPYYMMSPMIALAALLQLVRTVFLLAGRAK